MSILPNAARSIGVTVLLAIALTGCAAPNATAPTAGRDGTSQSPSGDPQACSLVTEQELTPMLGSDPGLGKDNSAGDTTACAYTGAGAVTIVIDHGAGETLFKGLCPNPPQQGGQTVAGIADGACLTIVGESIAAMYILKGSAVISINVQGGPGAKITPDALIALGKIAASRI